MGFTGAGRGFLTCPEGFIRDGVGFLACLMGSQGAV